MRVHLVDFMKYWCIACNNPRARGASTTKLNDNVTCYTCLHILLHRKKEKPEETYWYVRPHP